MGKTVHLNGDLPWRKVGQRDLLHIVDPVWAYHAVVPPIALKQHQLRQSVMDTSLHRYDCLDRKVVQDAPAAASWPNTSFELTYYSVHLRGKMSAHIQREAIEASCPDGEV